MNSRPSLLYLTPVTPARTGNGLAMRAGAVLMALVRHYDVTLAIVPRYGDRADALPEALRAACRRVVRPGDTPGLDERERFDVVHCFRLAMAPVAAPWLDRAGAWHLDLDEIESESRMAIAALLAANGDEARARQEREAAARARQAEDEAQARFDRVYIAAADDRDRLLAREIAGAAVVVLPNTLPDPGFSLSPPPAGGALHLLFVGTLGYAPNADAVRFFAREVLPILRDGDVATRFVVVGTGSGPDVGRLAGIPGVTLLGEVPDVVPCYRDAHVALAPLWAGGGTRIKILEAFALRRPVVTTTIGIAGIAADHGRHALIADTPETFAAACHRLHGDQRLASHIVDEAFALFRRLYTDDVLVPIVAPDPSVSKD
ncbi:MAG: glycosyltransferase [Thermomicrobiales bacterium]